jgi:hypothetical protein
MTAPEEDPAERTEDDGVGADEAGSDAVRHVLGRARGERASSSTFFRMPRMLPHVPPPWVRVGSKY